MRKCLGIGWAAVAAVSCASYTAIPPQDRATLERNLTGRHSDKFLRLSFYVTPFFGDASKKLLTAAPPEDVRLLEQPSGEAINPGPIQKILPAGTRVRILKVEFPTSWVVTERVLYTPRTQPWVYLQTMEKTEELPLILVLRPQIRSNEEFLAELERSLSDTDPAPILSRWSGLVREAVRTKNAVLNMPADALEMAWGYPERKRISFADSVKNEQWVYPGQRRTAYLTDGRVAKLETGKPES
jgi:hypothetical protein